MRVRLGCLSAVSLIAALASLHAQSAGLTFASTPIVSTLPFSPPPPVPNTAHPDVGGGRYSMTNPALADVNGDGYLDLVFAPSYFEFEPRLPIRIWLNTGGGGFVDRTEAIIDGPVPLVGFPHNVFVADLNSDKRSDIFIVDQGLENANPFEGGTNVLLLSQPDGRLRDVSRVAIGESIQTFNHESSQADIDSNGALDVIVSRLGGTRTFGDGLLLFLNDGAGNLRPSTTGIPDEIAWRLNTDSRPRVPDRQVAGANGVFDLNGDNIPDMVTGSYTGDARKTIRFFRQGLSGTLSEASRLDVPEALANIAYRPDTPTIGLGVAGINGADLNGDGRVDVLMLWEGRGTTYIEVLRNDGDFRFADVTLDWFGTYETKIVRSGNGYEYSPGPQRLLDINLDGRPDLWLMFPGVMDSNELVNARYMFLNDGSGRLRPVGYRTSGGIVAGADLQRAMNCVYPCFYRPLVFDATGDGQPDLVLVDQQSGQSIDSPTRESVVKILTFAANPPSNLLQPGASLAPGQALRSQNGRYRLAYQADGNLVLIDESTASGVWASNTSGTSAGSAVLQVDGNFLLLAANGTPVATTCTGGHPRAFLVLSDTGELEIRAPGGQRIWNRAQAMCR